MSCYDPVHRHCDVLVVGAGPVGLTAAHELARCGLSVRLIDAADSPATTSRALGIHARTLPAETKPSLQEKLDVHGVGLFSSGMFLLVIPLVLGRDAGWPLWTWFGATVK